MRKHFKRWFQYIFKSFLSLFSLRKLVKFMNWRYERKCSSLIKFQTFFRRVNRSPWYEFPILFLVYFIKAHPGHCIIGNILQMWSLLINGVEMPQGFRATTRRLFTFNHSRNILVLIWLTSEGWTVKSNMEPPCGFEPGTLGLVIESSNHKALSLLDYV